MAVKTGIVVIGSTPPPLHGTTLAVRMLLESELRRTFDVYHVNTRFEGKIKYLGRPTTAKLFRFVYYLLKIIFVMLRRNPAFVILTPAFGLSFIKDSIYINVIGRCFTARLILWCHGNGLEPLYEQAGSIRKRYIKSTLRQAAAIVPVTKSMIADNLNYLAHPRQIIFSIYNGLPDLDAEPEKSASSPYIRIVYLANLIIEKGWLLLFHAAKEICGEFENVCVEFYGEPDEDSVELISVFHNDNPYPERIVYKGPVYGEAKNRVLQDMNIFCFPSYFKLETFGIVNLEAMRAGKAIVTTRHSGLPEVVIDQFGGFVVEPRNLEQLVKKLRTLICDSEQRLKMGAFNRERYLRDFTLATHVQNWLRLLNLLESKR